ncbi:putative mitochondrial protein AtMg00860 [Nicotiana tabacum]|uniref:Mitochondrial protein AtMg00860 n=1 Tax=Nicotiana tabacum TaxID=4097 RepID=A0AC58TKY6_TOBAC
MQVIVEWQTPNSVKELRSFLGLENYYRKFIVGYSKKASPLTNLLKKNARWAWTEKCSGAFDMLEEAIATEPILRLQILNCPSKFILMLPTRLLEIWRVYLLGTKFVIRTNNVANTFFKKQKKLSPKQAR